MFQLLTVLLWSGLVLALIQTLRYAKQLHSEEFGVSALGLLAWINIFSFMGGFSIGLITIGINLIFGAILVFIVAKYRSQILFVTAASLLLLLFMRDFLPLARLLLELLLVSGLAVSLFQIYRSRKNRNQSEFSLACLGSVGILYFLSLLLNEIEPATISLAILAFVGAIVSIYLSSHFRWHFVFLSLVSLTWAGIIYMEWAG
jgi:hypothetical protein